MTEQTTTGVDEQAARRGVPRVLDLPDPWNAVYGDRRVDATDQVLAEARRHYADAVTCLAARMFRELLPDAHTVVFNKDEDDNGTRITLVTIRNASGELMWHEEGPYLRFASYPEAVALAELVAYGDRQYVEFGEETLKAIRSLLKDAYNTRPGHFETTDEPHPDGSIYDGNLLKLVVPDEVPAWEGDGPMPAVVVNRQRMKRWLASDFVTFECSLDDDGWTPTTEAVEELVTLLHDDPECYYDLGWQMTPNLGGIVASPSNTDTENAVIITALVIGGGRIATPPITNRELRTDKRGHEAALEALVYVAAVLSEAYPASNANS